jgi:hypothetical protein
VRLLHREVEGSLIAAQLMLAQATLRLHPCSNLMDEPQVASPRKVLLEIRRDIADAVPARRRRAFTHRIAQATRQRRRRTSSKVRREWPRRKPHKPPAAPRIITLSDEQKALQGLLEPAA